MSFKVKADIVALIKGLVTSLQPYAESQEVVLKYKEIIPSLYYYYNPTDILPDVTTMICRVIAFTPQSYKVMVNVDKCCKRKDTCILSIKNTGANLANVGEILKVYNGELTVESLDDIGTHFMIDIITKSKIEDNEVETIGQLLPKQYPVYYKEVSNKLTTHFANIANTENALLDKGEQESVFLKKVNAIINSNMNSESFSIIDMASAMALSRGHLYRKIKSLTDMSPRQYLIFTRLQLARKLLQNKNQDLNVSEVCYRVGFSSKSHFTRSFKKQFGFNPSECI